MLNILTSRWALNVFLVFPLPAISVILFRVQWPSGDKWRNKSGLKLLVEAFSTWERWTHLIGNRRHHHCPKWNVYFIPSVSVTMNTLAHRLINWNGRTSTGISRDNFSEGFNCVCNMFWVQHDDDFISRIWKELTRHFGPKRVFESFHKGIRVPTLPPVFVHLHVCVSTFRWKRLAACPVVHSHVLA